MPQIGTEERKKGNIMSFRKACLVATLLGVAGLPALSNEAGFIQPAPELGKPQGTATATPAQQRVLRQGDVSGDGLYMYAGSEPGWTLRPQRPDASRAMARVPARPDRPGDISPDGRHVYLGSEAGWSLRPHEIVWRDGQFAHADTCPHTAAKPSLVQTPEEKLFQRELRTGG